MIKLIISCLNVSFKKLIVWLELHPKLIASDYITTGRPLGRTKGVHSCVTPQGALSGGCEAWLANPSSFTYFNTNGRVSGLGETSWYEQILTTQTIYICNMIQHKLIKFISKVPIDNTSSLVHAMAGTKLMTSHSLNQW